MGIWDINPADEIYIQKFLISLRSKNNGGSNQSLRKHVNSLRKENNAEDLKSDELKLVPPDISKKIFIINDCISRKPCSHFLL